MKKSSLLSVVMMIVFGGFVFLFQEVAGQGPMGFSVGLKKDRLEISFATKKVADFVFADPKILRPYFSNRAFAIGFQGNPQSSTDCSNGCYRPRHHAPWNLAGIWRY